MTAVSDAISGVGVVSPYKGLGYYRERDAPFFFGREHETAIIAANLVAARLTLLYGASGVGKSSLLRAGVARELRDRARESLRASGAPGAVVVIFPADEEGGARRNSWRDDPIVELRAGIESAVAELGLEVEPVEASLRFPELLEAWSGRLGSDVLLILDQFEEYFLYHGAERGPGTFFDELSRALTRGDLGVNVLLSIREDAYSKLDSFKGRIPFLYDNYLRVEHLDADAARDAIERPIEQYNELVAPPGEEVSIEPELVKAILGDVQTGQLALGQSGAGSVAAPDGRKTQIETPFLQLVLERLWDEEIGAGSRTLRLSTLERLGGGARIVRTHLDAAMASLTDDEKELAARAFRQLVTPSGTKIAHLPSDLAALEEVPADRLATVLDKLAIERILRPIAPPLGQAEPRYEIFHDVLAPAILDWRARYLHERGERRRRRRLRVGGGVLAAVLLAGLAAGLWIVVRLHNRTHNAQVTAFVSEARAAPGFAGVFVANDALTDAAFSPDGRWVLTASEEGKAGVWPAAGATGPSGGTLRREYDESGLTSARYDPSGRFVVTAGAGGVAVWTVRNGNRTQVSTSPATAAVFNPRGDLIAAAGVDGTTRVVRWPGGRVVATFGGSRQAPIRSAEFSPDGRFVATAGDDGEVRLWLLPGFLRGSFRATDHGAAYSARFSPDGGRLVTGGEDGTFRVWDLYSGRRLQRVQTGTGIVSDASFSPDGKFIVTASGTVARVWVRSRSRPALEFRGHIHDVSTAVFNNTGSLVLTSGADGTARLWTVVLPDLNVQPAALSERSGSRLEVTFKVVNTGGARSVATSAQTSVSGLQRLDFALPSLLPGGIFIGHAILRVPASARGKRVTVRVAVNPQRRAVESDYSNNTDASTFVVARPDLDVVTKAAASDANGRVVVLVQVTNVGSGGSTATTLVSHPPGYAAAAANVPPLAPHGRVKLQLVLQAKRGAHAEQAKVTVDPGGSTGDNILGNNSDLTQLLPAFGP